MAKQLRNITKNKTIKREYLLRNGVQTNSEAGASIEQSGWTTT
jgi:hypothetical protein